jgi:hypothetical protein
MSMERVAAEAAWFSRDALAALQKVPGLAVALTPIAPIGLQTKSCCKNKTQCKRIATDKSKCACPGSSNASLTSLSFESLLLKAMPQLYTTVDWFASHAYPCAYSVSAYPCDVAHSFYPLGLYHY